MRFVNGQERQQRKKSETPADTRTLSFISPASTGQDKGKNTEPEISALPKNCSSCFWKAKTFARSCWQALLRLRCAEDILTPIMENQNVPVKKLFFGMRRKQGQRASSTGSPMFSASGAAQTTTPLWPPSAITLPMIFLFRSMTRPRSWSFSILTIWCLKCWMHWRTMRTAATTTA